MTNRFFTPNVQFISNSGVPLAGGFLNFYTTGTDTPLNTYSNAALTIANTNPIELDSDGYAGSIFLQNLPYKVVLEDANGDQVWTMDPVYSSDYSTFAQFRPYNGNPNGFVAGTAGTVGALPGTSAVWDYVNNVLYIATTTGNAATTVWTAVNAAAATSTLAAPQGYLTLASDPSNPILTTDAVAATSIYYTPYIGNQIAVYNGASFVTTSFTQLVLSLTASHAASTIYDVFVFNNSGVLTLVTGPAWANSTAGSCARGTGASTTQLSRLNGLWVNTVQIAARNGSTTYNVAANNATYVGSIFVNAVAGQVSCLMGWGLSRKWGVWNVYNRVPITMKAGDSTASWSYTTNTIRAANGSSANSITVFSGLAEEMYDFAYTILNTGGDAAIGETVAGQVNVGYNSTTTGSGSRGFFRIANNMGGGGALNNMAWAITAEYKAPPSLGINVITALENGLGATRSTWNGTETNMVLSAQYRG